MHTMVLGNVSLVCGLFFRFLDFACGCVKCETERELIFKIARMCTPSTQTPPPLASDIFK